LQNLPSLQTLWWGFELVTEFPHYTCTGSCILSVLPQHIATFFTHAFYMYSVPHSRTSPAFYQHGASHAGNKLFVRVDAVATSCFRWICRSVQYFVAVSSSSRPECWNIHSQDYSFPGTFVPTSACIICKSNVTGRQHALECDTCGLWCHRKCRSRSGGRMFGS